MLLGKSFLRARLIGVQSGCIPSPRMSTKHLPMAASGNQAVNLMQWPESSLSAPKTHESGLPPPNATICFESGAPVTWTVFQRLQQEQPSHQGKHGHFSSQYLPSLHPCQVTSSNARVSSTERCNHGHRGSRHPMLNVTARSQEYFISLQLQEKR